MTFKSPGMKKILQYVKEKYDTEPEFLWAKTPDTAILRHKDNQKWYAALLVIPKEKLGIKKDGNVDVLNLKCDLALIDLWTDYKSIFPGYHMNKKHWISVLLDGSVEDKEIFSLIDMSYGITRGNKNKDIAV